MLYTIASEAWSPGLPLTPAETPGGLFRTRKAASRIAAGRPTLAVALCHDATRGVVVAQRPAALALGGSWSAPAIVNDSGGVTVLSAVPAALVREVGRPEIRIHPGQADPRPRPLRQSTGPPRRGLGRARRGSIDAKAGPSR